MQLLLVFSEPFWQLNFGILIVLALVLHVSTVRTFFCLPPNYCINIMLLLLRARAHQARVMKLSSVSAVVDRYGLESPRKSVALHARRYSKV